MHCKYLSVVPYRALEKFSKALYGTTGGNYSVRVFRPVMWEKIFQTVSRLVLSVMFALPKQT